MKTRYYKGKYLVAVYNTIAEGETLIALCDNTAEFADYSGKSFLAASNALSDLFSSKRKYIIIKNKIRYISFIEVDEDDLQDTI